MPLGPDIVERLNRARADLRMGVPVLLTDGARQVLAASAETLSADRLADLRALGPLALAITQRRAETLKARVYDGDLARIAVPEEAGLDWLRAVADPADDLRSPMKGPFACAREGNPDLHRAAIALMKSAHLLPAAAVVPLPDGTAPPADLTRLDLGRTMPLLSAFAALHPVAAARVPMAAAEAGRLHIFRPEDGGEEHYAIEVGSPPRDRPVLARLHSACFTGDVLGSLKCDCGPQLHAALERMGEEREGILLYLNQEGRGIGLANKMRAYSLQDQGFDTVDANNRLGLPVEARDFPVAARMLALLGVHAIRLMTNNPAKVAALEAEGVTVAERVPHSLPPNPHNERYLATKRKRTGHLL